MSRFLVDTSAYSALFGGDPAANEAFRHCEEAVLSPVIIGELLYGFGNGRQRRANERGLAEFLSEPRVRVVGIDEETASRYAAIRASLRAAGTPIPSNDIWIAASAMQHGLEVLTSDFHYDKVAQVVVRSIRFAN